MKVALVHDYLNQLGGGERVLDALIKLFPEAPVYTLLHDPSKTQGRYVGKVKKTSFLDLPFVRRHHRSFIPLMPLAIRSMDLGDEYDLIISDTAGFAKGIRYGTKTKHLCYVHTPLRYAWETKTYFHDSLKNWLIRFFGALAFAYLRHWDYLAGQRPDIVLANSEFIAEKIKRYYHRDAQVLYPPVDTAKFYFESSVIASEGEASQSQQPGLPREYPRNDKQGYYLALGRFLEYKRFDLIIEAFKKNGLPLKVVGAGRQELPLRRLAEAGRASPIVMGGSEAKQSSNIEFIDFQPDEKLCQLYAGAKAFIMANEEDFGLVMAEAQACGTPVIAYAKGGALEIINDPSSEVPLRKIPKWDFGTVPTGILFSEQTPESLSQAIKKCETMNFDRAVIRKGAERFSEANFSVGLQKAIDLIL